MNNITLIKDLDLAGVDEPDADKDVSVIFNGPRRQVLEIRLRNGAILPKHHANEPITVLCVSGLGTFKAGAELEDSQKMRPGTLITLEPGVEHEAVAQPSLHLLVTKFKDS